jgi:hypothetical protein
MTQTIRTVDELLNTLFADGQPVNSITPQDVRDLIASIPYLSGRGWTFDLDGEYTNIARRTITAGTRTQITINGFERIGHPVAGQFWDTVTNRILPSAANDFGTVRVAVTGETTSLNNRFDLELDVGGSFPIIFRETKVFAKPSGQSQSFNFVIPLFAGPDFMLNGGKLYITPLLDAEFWEFGLTAMMDYKASPV